MRSGHDAEIATYFQMECSACGRPLRVLVRYLGHYVACSHCGCKFLATNCVSSECGSQSAMNRAEQLLACYSREFDPVRQDEEF